MHNLLLELDESILYNLSFWFSKMLEILIILENNETYLYD